jgi:glycosyltransferase A (GT-A) superfamily protein (DUF2064 family)
MGYQNCVIVGSDLFDLKASIIETAFEKLVTHEVVIGTCRRWWLLFITKTKQSSYFPKQKLGNRYCFKATMKDLKSISLWRL